MKWSTGQESSTATIDEDSQYNKKDLWIIKFDYLFCKIKINNLVDTMSKQCTKSQVQEDSSESLYT